MNICMEIISSNYSTRSKIVKVINPGTLRFLTLDAYGHGVVLVGFRKVSGYLNHPEKKSLRLNR